MRPHAERARESEAAQETSAKKALSAGARCIAVNVGGALYGLPVEDVQEVMAMRPLTRVFHAPDALAGVTSLRGEVLPVLDLAILLGAPAALTAPEDPRIVVVREKADARRRAGLRVDALSGLRDLPATGLVPTPSTLGELARALVVGVIADPPPCSVLGVAEIFASPLLAALSGRDEYRD